MTKSRLPKSQRKFIRREKARIRREVLDLKKQKELIDVLYQKFLSPKVSKSKIQKPKIKKSLNKKSKPKLKKSVPVVKTNSK